METASPGDNGANPAGDPKTKKPNGNNIFRRYQIIMMVRIFREIPRRGSSHLIVPIFKILREIPYY